MEIKARHQGFVYGFFKRYAIWKIRRHFSKVDIQGEFIDKQKPVLVIANHVSWWDGFWLMYLNRQLLRRKFFFMMMESQLKKYWVFTLAGGFPIQKKSKQAIESLNYATRLLKEPSHMVVIFPQGDIQSQYCSTMVFHKGVGRIISSLNKEIHILFVVNLTDYWSKEKPRLTQYIMEYKFDDFDFTHFQQAFQLFYQQSVNAQINEVNR